MEARGVTRAPRGRLSCPYFPRTYNKVVEPVCSQPGGCPDPFWVILGHFGPLPACRVPIRAVQSPKMAADRCRRVFRGPNFVCSMTLHGANFYPATGSLRAAVPEIQNSDPLVAHLLACFACLLALLKNGGHPPDPNLVMSTKLLKQLGDHARYHPHHARYTPHHARYHPYQVLLYQDRVA